MDLRQITPQYFVSPQISPEDAPALAEAGFTQVICNRPDEEVEPPYESAQIGEAVRAAGLAFDVLPVTRASLSQDDVTRQAELIGAGEKVLAYCFSGTRSTMVWALGQAGKRPVSEILTAAAAAGYDLSGLQPTLQALAESAGSES